MRIGTNKGLNQVASCTSEGAIAMEVSKFRLFALILFVIPECDSKEENSVKFSSVISAIAEMRDEILADHPFLKMVADSSLPSEKRMSFMPYLTYFAMSFSDVLDSWIYFENPQSELEERINTAIIEDDFHYNFFLRDMETVAGYTIDRYGSYSAVMRHLWGDESRSVRQLVYSFVLCAKKYDHPIVTLTTLEVMEAVYLIIHKHIYDQGGIHNYEYFGEGHAELETNHSQTKWMSTETSPLEDLEVSITLKEQSLEVTKTLLDKFSSAFDSWYNLAMADDSIRPEKYIVEGDPPIRGFPESHPNKKPTISGRKTEL